MRRLPLKHTRRRTARKTTTVRSATVRAGLAGALLLLAGGCQSLNTRSATPALLTDSNAAVISAVGATAGTLLKQPPVRLNSQAFGTSSIVSLDAANRNSPRGRLATGRTLELPQRLQLLRIGRRCALEHVNSGARAWLETRSCSAEE